MSGIVLPEESYWRTYLNRVQETCRRITIANRKAKDTLRAVNYVRVSREEEALYGYSIQEQLIESENFIKQKGWRLVGTYLDDGYTGTNDKRPGFRRLMRDARRGCFDVVVVHKIDRFYRNAQGMLKVHSELTKNNVLFISLREHIDFTTIWGKLILTVLSVLAEIFIDNLREETRKGKHGRARQGLWNGSVPFGYCRGNCSTCTDPNGPDYCPEFGQPDRNTGKGLVPHPIESVAVRLAFEWYATGRYSDRDIADMLNAYEHELPDGRRIHFRSKGRNYKEAPEDAESNKHYSPPGPFGKDTVRSILTRPFYAGVVAYYGSHFDGEQVVKHKWPNEIFPGKHVPLISTSLFERCQVVREARGQAPQGREQRHAARVYLLSGLLDCARCGEPMRSQSGGGNVRRHVCSTRIKRKGACDQPSVKAEVLEAQIEEIMSRVRIPDDWQERILAYLLDEGGLEVIRRQRQALEEAFAQVRALYEAGELGRKAYLREKRAYERRLQALRLDDSARPDVAEARRLLSDFPSLWKLATPIEKKGLLQLMLTEARVDDQRIVSLRWYKPFDTLLEEGVL